MAQQTTQGRWAAFRSWFYDVVIVSMTSTWYRSMLVRVPMEAHILDVGIGTATSLLHNRDIVESKRLHVVGVDIDEHYVAAAKENIARCKLQDRVEVVCTGDYKGGPFDAVYFSGSFMIIPDKVAFLKRCVAMLRSREDSRVYFSQTLEHRGVVGSFMEWFKPWLATLTTIDFGTVTYRDVFEGNVKAAGMAIEGMHIVKKGWFRDQVLVVARMA